MMITVIYECDDVDTFFCVDRQKFYIIYAILSAWLTTNQSLLCYKNINTFWQGWLLNQKSILNYITTFFFSSTLT